MTDTATLHKRQNQMMSGIYVLATPIGNLLDLSERAKLILSNCHLIFAEDTRITRKLLTLLNLKKPPLGIKSLHKFSEAKTVANLNIKKKMK